MRLLLTLPTANLIYISITGVQFNTYGLELLKTDTKGMTVKALLSSLETDTYLSLCDTVSSCDGTVREEASGHMVRWFVLLISNKYNKNGCSSAYG